MLEKHTHAGIQFPGRHEVAKILEELERQKEARHDVVANTKSLEFKVRDGQMLMDVNVPGHRMLVPCSKRVWAQLAESMGIRRTDRLYKWLSLGTQTPYSQSDGTIKSDKRGRSEPVDSAKNWQTWTNLINDYLHTEQEGKLVRCIKDLKGQTYCRAILSDRYEVVPNADFFYAIVESLQKCGAEVWHARLSEDKFYGYAVAKGITGQVSTERTFDPGDGWKSRWYGKEGDTFNAACAFGNSETGEGGIFLSAAILRRVCENYNVWHDVVTKTHIGKRHEMDHMLTNETIKLRNQLFFSKIKDYTAGIFDPQEFQEMIDSMNGATKDVVEDAEKAADALQLCYDLSEERKAAIRNMFIKSNDNSRYGLVNAVTAFAHDPNLDPDEGFNLERMSTELFYTDMEKFFKKADKLKSEKKKKDEVLEPVGAGSGAGIADI